MVAGAAAGAPAAGEGVVAAPGVVPVAGVAVEVCAEDKAGERPAMARPPAVVASKRRRVGSAGRDDLSFMMIIILLFFNIIFGIIIDTFAGLRDEAAVMEDDMKNVCFICGVDRQTGISTTSAV